MSKVIVMEPEEFVNLLQTEIRKATDPLEKAIRDLENQDEWIGLEEAMRITKLSKTQIYQYIHDGILNHYGEGRKPCFSRKECEIARLRKRELRLQK